MGARNAKMKIYDSVFTDLFSDTENQLRLYKDLHPEDTDVTADEIKTVTIKPVFTDQLYNDLGFTVKDKTILLVEAQSTWCPNMTLRALLYLAETYRQYILDTDQNYYSTKTVSLPRPELYVIYTGDAKHDEETLSLAETFWDGECSAIDVRVKVLYGDEPEAILSEYSAFTRAYRKNRSIYGPTRKAVMATIEECIENDILKEYLESRKAEVVDMMMSLFDDDLIQEMHERSIRRESREEGLLEGRKEGRKEGRTEGRKEGRAEAGYEAVDKLVAKGILSVAEACETLEVDARAYEEYLRTKR